MILCSQISLPSLMSLRCSVQQVIWCLQVRSLFGSKLRAAVVEAASVRDRSTFANTCWLCKFLAIMCFSMPDPTSKHREAMAEALMTCLSIWWERFADVGETYVAIGEEYAEVGSGKDTELAKRPEYSIFFLMFLLAQHVDCPTPEELESVAESPMEGDEEVCRRSAHRMLRNAGQQMEVLMCSGPCKQIPHVITFACWRLIIPNLPHNNVSELVQRLIHK
jgi:hypothetical protein